MTSSTTAMMNSHFAAVAKPMIAAITASTSRINQVDIRHSCRRLGGRLSGPPHDPPLPASQTPHPVTDGVEARSAERGVASRMTRLGFATYDGPAAREGKPGPLQTRH